MTYYEDLGAVVQVQGTKDNFEIAQLQITANRVILGARNDAGLSVLARSTAAAATGIPIAVDGNAGNQTLIASRLAGVISGVSTTSERKAHDVAVELDRFATSRGYPASDTAQLVTPQPPGAPGGNVTLGDFPKLSTMQLAAIAIGAGVLLAVAARRRKKNPARRRRHTRRR